jgi:hypothetical protein
VCIGEELHGDQVMHFTPLRVEIHTKIVINIKARNECCSSKYALCYAVITTIKRKLEDVQIGGGV